ncbi:PAAR domain-containing protein [Pseudoduganella violacea]|uniref:Putative Zn-binding protein involved in type VI secretion n=1 Tax=Pseudoduganella violacea TaxID=1715466 RepID=A0A7W5B708_9BURK|nr:putative Zn-binding protein involved in type VI secretion [Pseudoduganella violacea]
MARAVICQGDATSHGGKVLEGNPDATIDGRPIALRGHLTYCPLCKGQYPISEGLDFHTFGGIGTAVEGMKTACGATLIASQHLMTVDDQPEASSTQGARERERGTNKTAPTAPRHATNQAPHDTSAVQRVVITGKRLSPSDQEAWYKQQMRASMPDYGRSSPSEAKGSRPGVLTGALSMKYETGMPPARYREAAGVVSSGKKDKGGISYGAYQLASKSGQVQRFLKAEGRPWSDQFKDMDPSKPGEFGERWKAIATSAGDDFFNAQHQYIERTHFDPLVAKLTKKSGLDINAQPQAVKDAAWSASVQHAKAFDFLESAISHADKALQRNSPQYPEKLINDIYDARIDYVESLDIENKKSLYRRYDDERNRAMQMLRQGKE